jgi:hypothetical protein
MDHARVVRGREPARALREDLDDRRHRRRGRQPLRQRHARRELHGHEQRALRTTDIEHAHDIGVIDPRERPALSQHALLHELELCLARHGQHELERDVARELGVACEVDDAHRARAELLHDLVAPQPLARQCSQRVRTGRVPRDRPPELRQRHAARRAPVDVHLE